jgi:hypothetical protein
VPNTFRRSTGFGLLINAGRTAIDAPAKLSDRLGMANDKLMVHRYQMLLEAPEKLHLQRVIAENDLAQQESSLKSRAEAAKENASALGTMAEGLKEIGAILQGLNFGKIKLPMVVVPAAPTGVT